MDPVLLSHPARVSKAARDATSDPVPRVVRRRRRCGSSLSVRPSQRRTPATRPACLTAQRIIDDGQTAQPSKSTTQGALTNMGLAVTEPHGDRMTMPATFTLSRAWRGGRQQRRRLLRPRAPRGRVPLRIVCIVTIGDIPTMAGSGYIPLANQHQPSCSHERGTHPGQWGRRRWFRSACGLRPGHRP